MSKTELEYKNSLSVLKAELSRDKANTLMEMYRADHDQLVEKYNKNLSANLELTRQNTDLQNEINTKDQRIRELEEAINKGRRLAKIIAKT